MATTKTKKTAPFTRNQYMKDYFSHSYGSGLAKAINILDRLYDGNEPRFGGFMTVARLAADAEVGISYIRDIRKRGLAEDKKGGMGKMYVKLLAFADEEEEPKQLPIPDPGPETQQPAPSPAAPVDLERTEKIGWALVKKIGKLNEHLETIAAAAVIISDHLTNPPTKEEAAESPSPPLSALPVASAAS